MVMVLLAVLVLLTACNYVSFRDYRYPPFLASLLWLGVLTLYRFSPVVIDSISALTALIFLAVVLSFTGGGQLALLLYSRQSHPPCVQGPGTSTYHRRARVLFLLISLALLPVMLARANAIVQQSGVDNWLVGLRTETSDPGVSPYGLLGNVVILSFVTTFFYAIEVGKDCSERVQYYCSLALSGVYAVFSTGRTPFLLLIVSLLAISAMRRRLSWKTLAGATAVFAVVFAIFAVILGKGGDLDSSVSDNLGSVEESFFQYAIGAIPAFDQVVRSDPTFEYGKNTFLEGVNLTRRLTGRPQLSPVQEVVNVPFPSNVYTAAQPPFKDFGIVGIILAFAGVGAASTYCYLRAVQGDGLYIFYFALGLFPLTVMAFSDQYFAPAGSSSKYLLLAYLYFRTGPKMHRRLPGQGRTA